MSTQTVESIPLSRIIPASELRALLTQTPSLIRRLSADVVKGTFELSLDCFEGEDVTLRFRGVRRVQLQSPGMLDGLVSHVQVHGHPQRRGFGVEIQIESMDADGHWTDTALFIEAETAERLTD